MKNFVKKLCICVSAGALFAISVLPTPVYAAISLLPGETVIGNSISSGKPARPAQGNETNDDRSTTSKITTDIPDGTKRIYWNVTFNKYLNSGGTRKGELYLLPATGSTEIKSFSFSVSNSTKSKEGYIDLSVYPDAKRIKLVANRTWHVHYSGVDNSDTSVYNEGNSYDTYSLVTASFLGLAGPIFSENPGSNLTFL